jgi:hypothetical protein
MKEVSYKIINIVIQIIHFLNSFQVTICCMFYQIFECANYRLMYFLFRQNNLFHKYLIKW